MAVGGQSEADGSNQIVLARFNADGSADTSFGTQVIPERQCPHHPGGAGFGNIPNVLSSIQQAAGRRQLRGPALGPARCRRRGSSTSRGNCSRQPRCRRSPEPSSRRGSTLKTSFMRPRSHVRVRTRARGTVPARMAKLGEKNRDHCRHTETLSSSRRGWPWLSVGRRGIPDVPEDRVALGFDDPSITRSAHQGVALPPRGLARFTRTVSAGQPHRHFGLGPGCRVGEGIAPRAACELRKAMRATGHAPWR